MSDIQTNVIKPSVFFEEDTNVFRNINEDFEKNLDTKYKDVIDFIKVDGKGKTDLEKDSLYKEAQQLWNEYTNSLKSTKYNFNLNLRQWEFLSELILEKLEYNVNTVFLAIELTNILGTMKESSFSSDTESKAFLVDATELTYIYHLISEHKVIGLNKDTYTFSEILKRIGSVSKVFNYYDTIGKNLAADIQDWVALFDEGVSVDQNHQLEIDFNEK